MEIENEKKTEEVKTEEKADEKNTIQAQPSEEKALAEKVTSKGREYAKKCCEICGKNKKTIAAVILVAALISGAFAFKAYWKKVDIGPVAVKEKIQTFLKENAKGSDVEIKTIEKEGDLYKVELSIQKQDASIYVTRDGKKLIPVYSVVEMDKKATDGAVAGAATEKTETENKTDVPVVDLFVMSYCPYGLQMERGILPAVEALGNKIKFNLKFVGYTLHGKKEIDENLNQYCIEKTQPAKLGAYLKCFWKKSTGTADACMKTVGVNSAQVKSCVADAMKQFNPTEKDFGINKEDTLKYGVKGSPTLVVNGTVVSSSRDSASVLKAICSGFTNKPKECDKQLSSAAPGAGFDDQISAAGASGNAANSGANCGN